MTDYNKILITSLNNYLNDNDEVICFDSETADSLIRQAREHKVLPIVFLKNSPTFKNVLSENAFAKIKNEVMFSVSSQLQRNAELVRICSILEENGLKYIVFKGASCRALYNNPEYRISSDEDFLVGEHQIDCAKQIFTENGYSVVEQKDGEIKLYNKALRCLVELHSSIVNRTASEAMKNIGDLFISQLDNPHEVDTVSEKIKTFSPTLGFLSLCVHFFNHFVRGGIGIRPIMDIACFVKSYSDEIDFDYCFSLLKTINADKAIRTVIALCKEYFEIESEYAENAKAVDGLLNDILGAGAYGTADVGRIHSGTVTKGAVYGNRGLISAVIPSKKSVASTNPEIQGNSKEINRYRAERIKRFVAKDGKLKIIKTVGKRKKLLKKLGIIK